MSLKGHESQLNGAPLSARPQIAAETCFSEICLIEVVGQATGAEVIGPPLPTGTWIELSLRDPLDA